MIHMRAEGHVLLITMQGETDLNIGVMGPDLWAAFDEFERDDGLWCAVLTSAGQRAFSAGADVKALARDGLSARFWEGEIPRFLSAEGIGKPVIAAINGHAVGAGMIVALACDIRLAAANATFALPELKFGIPPVLGATQRLARRLPETVAMQMLLSGRSITAAQAERWGLVSEVLPQDRLLDEALSLARDIAANPPLAVQAAKELVRNAGDMTLAQGMRQEAVLSHLVRTTADSKESLNAFREKRAPAYRRE